MKKFFLKLALALLPVAVYIAFFVAFEPNNYFGLHDNGDSQSVISKIRGFESENAANIILGDSRLAHFDDELVAAHAGVPFANLAFGGASLEESIDLFYYAYAQNPDLERVVLGMSFYTLNENYGSVNRMATIETQLKNPLAYIFNLEYNINTLQNFVYIIQGVETGGEVETATYTEKDYLDSVTGEVLPYRANLITYAASLYGNCAATTPQTTAGEAELAQSMLGMTSGESKFAVNETQLTRLLEMADFCRENGIELFIVLPPVNESVHALVCTPLGIDVAMQNALALLENAQGGGVRLLDYEWANPLPLTEEQFFDGFHIDTVYGLPYFTEVLFSEVANGA